MKHLKDGQEHVLYIEVGPATGQWVRFGPVEEKTE
jgi:hypothetical protein